MFGYQNTHLLLLPLRSKVDLVQIMPRRAFCDWRKGFDVCHGGGGRHHHYLVPAFPAKVLVPYQTLFKAQRSRVNEIAADDTYSICYHFSHLFFYTCKEPGGTQCFTLGATSGACDSLSGMHCCTCIHVCTIGR